MTYKALIIIPAFNEEKSIRRVCLDNLSIGDVLVMDDCSSDKTREEALKTGAKVITNDTNLGYQNNLYKGIFIAIKEGYDFAITVDGDGQFFIKDIKKILDELFRGATLVVGIRNSIKRESEKIICNISKVAFKISDPLCGLKGYRLSEVKKINSKTLFEKDTVASGLAIELKNNYNTQFSEIKISIQDRFNGVSTFGKDDFYSNYNLLKLFSNNFI